MLALVSIISWHTVNTDRSPFVDAFNTIGLTWAATGLNVIILLAAFSVMAASYFASTQMIVSLGEVQKAPHAMMKHSGRGFYRNAWLTVAIGVLVVVALSFVLPSTLYNYLVSASSYFTFLNWTLNLITYLIWWRKREEKELLIAADLGASGGVRHDPCDFRPARDEFCAYTISAWVFMPLLAS